MAGKRKAGQQKLDFNANGAPAIDLTDEPAAKRQKTVPVEEKKSDGPVAMQADVPASADSKQLPHNLPSNLSRRLQNCLMLNRMSWLVLQLNALLLQVFEQ